MVQGPNKSRTGVENLVTWQLAIGLITAVSDRYKAGNFEYSDISLAPLRDFALAGKGRKVFIYNLPRYENIRKS